MILEDYSINDNFLRKIGQFSLAWGLMEYVYFDNDARIDKIKALSIPTVSEDMANKIHLFREQLRKFIIQHGDTVNEETVREYLFTEIASSNGVDECLSFLNGETDDICNCLICIFRMRNNLFHGEKDIWKISKQEGLFDSILDILEPFVAWKQINDCINNRTDEQIN